MTKVFHVDRHKQTSFAELSGDYNPIHVDHNHARRLLYGEVLVHGVHAALWMLDQLFYLAAWQGKRIQTLEVSFNKPIFLGKDYSLSHILYDESQGRACLQRDDDVCVRLTVTLREAGLQPQSPSAYDTPAKIPCAVLDPKDCLGLEGELRLGFDKLEFATLFPHIDLCSVADGVNALLGSTRLVGMRCPGEHSLFQSLSLQRTAVSQGHNKLHYTVTQYHEALAYMMMDIEAPSYKGKISALTRPAPVLPVDYSVVCQRVDKQRYAGQTAFIVGGSRGLGEACVHLLAAGGARVIFSYCHGRERAEEMVAKIRSQGGKLSTFHYDASDKNASIPSEHLESITHVYYFATGKIRSDESSAFDLEMFSRYCEVYLQGFDRVVRQVQSKDKRAVSFVYPSSAFLNELDTEHEHYIGAKGAAETHRHYICAKAAAEALCQCLAQKYPSCHFLMPRLPRLDTDQGRGIAPTKLNSPIEVMQNMLDQYHQCGAALA